MLNLERTASPEIIAGLERRRNRLLLGFRREAQMPSSSPIDHGDLRESLYLLDKICQKESVARYGDECYIARVKGPYARHHAMAVFNPRRWFADRDQQVWTNIGMVPDAVLQPFLGCIGQAADAMFIEFPEDDEVFVGCNGGMNMSQQNFLHAHLYGTRDADWRAITPEQLAQEYPARERLIKHNDGCRDHERNIIENLVREHPVFASPPVSADSGSYFIALQGKTIGEVLNNPAVVQMLKDLDTGLREMFDQWGIAPSEQCIAFSVSKRRGEDFVVLTVQTAVKSPDGPASGVAEANHFILQKGENMSEEESREYGEDVERIGRLFSAN